MGGPIDRAGAVRRSAELGEWAGQLRTSPTCPGSPWTRGAKFLRGDGPPDLDLVVRREKLDQRVLGPAMVAALFNGLLDRGVEVATGAPAGQLVLVDGAVLGVEVTGDESGPDRGGADRGGADGRRELLGARRGVVLACGGFEWNEAMVRAFIGPAVERLSPPHNTGDGHRMAVEAGAELANMTSYWGQPAILVFGPAYPGGGATLGPALTFGYLAGRHAASRPPRDL